MPKNFLVSWHMDGTIELQADSAEQVEEMMKTLNRQELALKSRYFDYQIEPVDLSGTEPER
ncbi:MAG: hypothetical protein AAB368_05725 [bacterium]